VPVMLYGHQYVCVCVCVCVYEYMCLYMHVCMCVYICMCVCIDTNVPQQAEIALPRLVSPKREP
jgi:hypothetical protein